MRAGPRRLRGAEPAVARPAGADGARLGQPGVAAGSGARGRPACEWQRTTRERKHSAAAPRWAVSRSGHKQPNVSAGLTPSVSKRAQRTPDTAGASGPVTAIADNPD